MIVGVPRESYPGERRVALVPSVIPTLAKGGLEVIVEAGAGMEAGYPDATYAAKGGKIIPTAPKFFTTPTSSRKSSATAQTTKPATPTSHCSTKIKRS